MMFNYPYLNSPYYNRYSRYGYRYPYYNSKNNMGINAQVTQSGQNANLCNTTEDNNLNKNKNLNSIENENKNKDTNDIPMFEIFGIKLYFDDILLICLIFFLYDEGVKDQSLFIALILLLLS